VGSPEEGYYILAYRKASGASRSRGDLKKLGEWEEGQGGKWREEGSGENSGDLTKNPLLWSKKPTISRWKATDSQKRTWLGAQIVQNKTGNEKRKGGGPEEGVTSPKG